MLGVMIAVLAGILLWLALGARHRDGQEPEVDEETRIAEQEVRDLDAFTSPEDADDELPDWGPGTPKRRR
jgi:hypothetical protein